MTPHSLCSLFLTAAGRLLLGTLAIGVLSSCGGQKPTPIVQASPSSNSAASPTPSPAASSTPSPAAKDQPASPAAKASPAPSALPSPIKLPDERSEEVRAQMALLSLTSGQQARFAEKKEFAAAIADIDKKWQPPQTYEIVMKAEGREKVVITAKAKEDGLKSYAAVVYGFESASTATAVTCGTLSASKTPPGLAEPPKSADDRLFCPPGTYRWEGISESPPKKS
jgi:hypothetical protein